VFNVSLGRHKTWIMLDIYKRKLFLKHYLKRFLLRAIKRSTTSSNSKRYLAYMYLVRSPRFASFTFLNNRCTKTGRVWSTNKRTSLSRFELRGQIYKSNIPGFRRASW
jgi:ribosomal protein S14